MLIAESHTSYTSLPYHSLPWHRANHWRARFKNSRTVHYVCGQPKTFPQLRSACWPLSNLPKQIQLYLCHCLETTLVQYKRFTRRWLPLLASSLGTVRWPCPCASSSSHKSQLVLSFSTLSTQRHESSQVDAVIFDLMTFLRNVDFVT